MTASESHDDTTALHDFLQPGYEFAYAQLRDEGSLSPFAVGFGPNGSPVCIMPEDGSPETLKALAQEALDIKRFPTIARFVEVTYASEEKDPGRALAVFLDGSLCNLVLTPFSFVENELVCAHPTTLENSDALILAAQPERLKFEE